MKIVKIAALVSLIALQASESGPVGEFGTIYGEESMRKLYLINASDDNVVFEIAGNSSHPMTPNSYTEVNVIRGALGNKLSVQVGEHILPYQVGASDKESNDLIIKARIAIHSDTRNCLMRLIFGTKKSYSLLKTVQPINDAVNLQDVLKHFQKAK